MTEGSVVALAREFMQVVIQIAGPLLVVAVVVGVLVSVAQVLTSIQDATLAFVIRLSCVGIVTAALARWMINVLVRYTADLWTNIPNLIG